MTVIKCVRSAPYNMTSQWKGSSATANMVAGQIRQRWGEEAAKAYQPLVNCFTFRGWLERGYRVKKGEKSIQSITFVTVKDDEKRKFPKTEIGRASCRERV